MQPLIGIDHSFLEGPLTDCPKILSPRRTHKGRQVTKILAGLDIASAASRNHIPLGYRPENAPGHGGRD
jgi:hypothetical protein